MKIKGEYLLDTIGGEKMAVPLNTIPGQQTGIIRLNDVGCFLWELLSEEREESELVDAVTGEYEVDRATAARDVKNFLDKLDAQGILEK